MADWLDTWQVATVAVVLLLAPGIGPAYALGLRGLVAWGVAPLFSGAVTGAAAVATGALGWGWNVGWVAVASALASALTLGAWYAGGRRRTARLRPGGLRRAVVLAVGVCGVAAVALQLRRTASAIGSPDHVAQTFDTGFHLNLVRMVLDSGDASSLHITLTQPGATTAFYPALWHGLVSIVVQLTGVAIPVAANWVTLAAVCVAWPLGMLALARTLFGTSPLLLGLAVPASFTLTQFPNRLVSFGLLYPNIVSYALLPAALALVVTATIRTHGRGRLPSAVGVLVGLVALVLAQPNGLFALAWVAVPLVVLALLGRTGRLRRAGRPWWVALAPWPVVLVAGIVIAGVAARIPIVAAFRGRVVWGVTTTWQHALVEAADLSAMHPSVTPNFPEPENLVGGTPSLLVALLVVVGGIAALGVRRWRWLPFSYAIVVGLYVLVRGLDIPLRGTLTGYWYADPQRLASLLPLIGVPLVTLALAAISRWAVLGARAFLRWRAARGQGASPAAHRRLRPPFVAAGAAIIVGLTVAVILPRGPAFRESFAYIAQVYAPDTHAGAGLLDADEERLFDEIDAIVPPTVTIAGNPWDGSSLVWALADREAIYPHTGMVMDADRAVIAQALKDAATDPQVCPAVERLRLGYVLELGHELWGSDHSGEYPGLQGLAEAGVVTLVAEEGEARLFRVTACQNVPPGQ